MAKRVLSTDPLTGLITYHDYDPDTDTTYISYDADSSLILDANVAKQNAPEISKKGVKQEFLHYAHIPVDVQIDWLINKGVDVFNDDHVKKVFALVNDPEYSKVKVTNLMHRPK